MASSNADVAALLQEYADLLTITGGPAYKARTYENAARGVAGHHADVSALRGAELRQIPGVGQSIADKIDEYQETGEVAELEKLRAKIPAGVRKLTEIPTLGPNRALALYEELGVASIEELVDAVHAGQLRGVAGFGAKSEEKLLHGVELLRQAGQRARLDVASDLAERILGTLTAVEGCERCTYAGSLRRMRETVGDLDILAVARYPGPLMDTFTELPIAEEVIARGDTKSSIRTTAGLQVDLRVVAPEAWGAALQYFTGSKAHNIRTREIAVRAGLKLSEYGLFGVEDGELVVSRTEEEVYERLGLPWIAPPLREDRGEIEAALRGELPELVTADDIRGDLHTHTNLTDGRASLAEMVRAAARRGYSYYAITDHAPNLVMQRMTDEKMLAQRAEVRALDGHHQGLRLLHGTELNIDAGGEVDWPEEVLAGFDICVASVHSYFTQSRDDTTARLLRACENPHINVLGHLTGRKIGRRAPIDADLDAVFRACARTGTALEINSGPDRLDLRDEHVLWAKRHGVKFAIDSDAHAVSDLDFLRYGLGTAQRGWLTSDDVINAWPLEKLRRFLRKAS